MVQNLRAYFMLYVVTIKCIKCKQENIELSCMSQRPRLISTKSLADKDKAAIKILQEYSQGLQKDSTLLPRGDTCNPSQPIATGLP